MPPIVDLYFKKIVAELDQSTAHCMLYFIPGVVFLSVMVLSDVLFKVFGTRICILLGSGLLSTSCYFFWPLTRKELDKTR